jgi:hypothetical protein
MAGALRELLARSVLRGNLKMPCDTELEKLARILERWRQTFLNEQVLLRRRELQDRALAAHKALADAISEIEKLDRSHFTEAAQESAPKHVLSYLSERLAESSDVGVLAARIGSHPGLAFSPSGYGASGWNWLADVLPVDFINSMKPTNPNFAPGLGHTGPIARFIAAVAPLITGEHPTPASTATQLKARRKTNLRAQREARRS